MFWMLKLNNYLENICRSVIVNSFFDDISDSKIIGRLCSEEALLTFIL